MVSKKRDAIMQSLLRLLEDRPLNRISVRDIVEDCGVNRNTFYYHFEDMPALVEAVVIDEVNQIIGRYDDISSIEECFDAAMQFCVKHRRAVYHIYNSANRDILERSLLEICEYMATKFIDNVSKDMDLRPGDREIIIQVYKFEFFGFSVDWLNSGMTGDAREKFLRFCELARGTTDRLLERSRIQ